MLEVHSADIYKNKVCDVQVPLESHVFQTQHYRMSKALGHVKHLLILCLMGKMGLGGWGEKYVKLAGNLTASVSCAMCL
jgi:hypothetical protein